MIEQYLTCPKCGQEILFEGENHSAGDFFNFFVGDFYTFGMCVPEYQKDCKCEFTDEEIQEMEIEVGDTYAENLGNDY